MNPPTAPSPASQDGQHLKLIEVFHYVMCLLAVLGSIFIFVHYEIMSTMTEMMSRDPKFVEQQRAQPMPFNPVDFMHAFKWFYLLMGLWALASLVLNLISARLIHARRSRLFSLIVAGLNCVNFPFGTALGVFTFIVLLRPTMPALYGEPPE